MDIYWYGQALFKLKGKSATVVIDPYDPEMIGLKAPKPSELEGIDAVLVTHPHKDHSNTALLSGEPIVINGPGEYEIKGVSITGVGLYHDKTQGSERGKNTVYHLSIDGLNIVHCGDLGHTLTDEQISEIGATDILLVPVGSVYTIDGKEASEVVAQLEPKIIIPMHYGGLPGLKPPLEGVDKFLKEMGAEQVVPQNKFTVTKDKLPDEPTVVVLNKN
jgi:L-ascorbate metabolism protein UlaG (beta-lactamase superfamily)